MNQVNLKKKSLIEIDTNYDTVVYITLLKNISAHNPRWNLHKKLFWEWNLNIIQFDHMRFTCCNFITFLVHLLIQMIAVKAQWYK